MDKVYMYSLKAFMHFKELHKIDIHLNSHVRLGDCHSRSHRSKASHDAIVKLVTSIIILSNMASTIQRRAVRCCQRNEINRQCRQRM